MAAAVAPAAMVAGFSVARLGAACQPANKLCLEDCVGVGVPDFGCETTNLSVMTKLKNYTFSKMAKLTVLNRA